MMKDSDDLSSDGENAGAIGTGIYVTELSPHDVLLGRGTGPSKNEGNVNFRIAVEDMKSAYVSTPSRKAKKRIVRKTIKAIKVKNGRFLSKLRKSEIKMLGLSHKIVYEVVSDSVAVEKTKQAIRYIHYKKDAKQDKKKSPDLKAKKAPTSKIKNEPNQDSKLGITASSDDSDHSVAWGSRNGGHQLFGCLPDANGAVRPVYPGFENRSNLLPALSSTPLPGSLLQSASAIGVAPASTGIRNFPSQATQRFAPLSRSLPSSSPPFFSSNEFNTESLFRAGGLSARVSESPSPFSSAGGAVQTQARMQPNTSLFSSGGLKDALLHSLPLLTGGPQGMSSDCISANALQQDERLRASLQLGQLQTALQDGQLRAILLGDEQYRRLLSSYLSQPN
jgi:hypothetical protein